MANWSSWMPPGGRTKVARRPAGERTIRRLPGLDPLHLDGRALLSQPLVRRREALRRVLRPGDEVVAVPAIATEGIALYNAVVAQGIAGVLARQRSSPYLPGVKSRLWRYVAAEAAVPASAAAPAADAEGAETAASAPLP
jgi:hypothetical protein